MSSRQPSRSLSVRASAANPMGMNGMQPSGPRASAAVPGMYGGPRQPSGMDNMPFRSHSVRQSGVQPSASVRQSAAQPSGRRQSSALGSIRQSAASIRQSGVQDLRMRSASVRESAAQQSGPAMSGASGMGYMPSGSAATVRQSGLQDLRMRSTSVRESAAQRYGLAMSGSQLQPSGMGYLPSGSTHAIRQSGVNPLMQDPRIPSASVRDSGATIRQSGVNSIMMQDPRVPSASVRQSAAQQSGPHQSAPFGTMGPADYVKVGPRPSGANVAPSGSRQSAPYAQQSYYQPSGPRQPAQSGAIAQPSGFPNTHGQIVPYQQQQQEQSIPRSHAEEQIDLAQRAADWNWEEHPLGPGSYINHESRSHAERQGERAQRAADWDWDTYPTGPRANRGGN